MRTFSKLYLMAAAALTLSFASCSSDDSDGAQEPVAKGSTYASLSISFPTGKAATRAGLPEDFNKNGTWKGRDEIKTITVFLYNDSVGTIDYSSFSASDFVGIGTDGMLNPTLAVKATPGQDVKAYVVVNDVNNIVTPALKAATPATFQEAYAAAYEAIASQVSSYNALKDVAMMTNSVKPTAIKIEPGISETDAKDVSKNKNLIKVQVERVVSRAMVTTTDDADAMKIEIFANKLKASEIAITKVTYAVGQSNKKFFNLVKSTFETPDPVYTYVPGAIQLILDNTGLASFTEAQKIANTTNTTVGAALGAETTSKFVLPVTHATDSYVKGNTTYFEIQATFTPDLVDGVAYVAGDDAVYLGQNDGKFYSSRTDAIASGQKATGYLANADKNGFITKYVVWLNPDVIPGTGGTTKASMSPTVRNQVYHVHVTGFKSIGVPANPLNPDEKIDPLDPKNPIDPKDPLETQDTYLSVQISVLDYTIHSYGVNIGTDY